MDLKRRDFLSNTSMVVAGLTVNALTSEMSFAAEKTPRKPSSSASVMNLDPKTISALSSFSRAAGKCVAEGKVCREHCETQLHGGNSDFNACHTAVKAMITVCSAMEELANQKSVTLVAAMLDTCHAACSACKDACNEHKDHHAECGGCFKGCENTIAALSNLKQALGRVA